MTQNNELVLYFLIIMIIPLLLSVTFNIFIGNNRGTKVLVIYTIMCLLVGSVLFSIEKDMFITCNKWISTPITVENMNLKDGYCSNSSYSNCIDYNITYSYNDNNGNAYSGMLSYISPYEYTITKMHMYNNIDICYDPENPKEHIEKNSYCMSCIYPYCINHKYEKNYLTFFPIVANVALNVGFCFIIIIERIIKF